MTTELTKAAQQAHTPEHIAGVDHAHELLRRMGYHRDGDWFIHANRRGAEAIHTSTISTIVNAGQLVITQRPAAQEVRSVKVRITDDPDVAEILRPAAPTAQQLESAAKVCDGFAAPDMAAALRGQSPAAQTEREAFEAWWESDGPNTSSPYEAAMSGWEAGRASLPAPQQATPATPEDMKVYDGIAAGYFADAQQATPDRHLTVTTNRHGDAVMVSWQDDEHRILEVVWERDPATPEPVGEVAAWWKRHRDGSIEVNEAQTFLAEDALATGRRPLVFGDTRPAPGVPEGFDVQAHVATGGGHEYPLITVCDTSTQVGEDVFPDEHPVIYGLLSALLAAAQAKGEQP